MLEKGKITIQNKVRQPSRIKFNIKNNLKKYKNTNRAKSKICGYTFIPNTISVFVLSICFLHPINNNVILPQTIINYVPFCR